MNLPPRDIGTYLRLANDSAKVATEADGRGERVLAMEAYIRTCDMLMKAMVLTPLETNKQSIRERLVPYLERAEKLKAELRGIPTLPVVVLHRGVK